MDGQSPVSNLSNSNPPGGRHPGLQSPAERRRFKRQSCALSAQVHTATGLFTLQTTSVSTDGIFLRSAQVPAVGFALHLTVSLPDGPVECVAAVVRSVVSVGFGCRITVAGTSERRRWSRYIESLYPELVLTDVLADPRDWFDFEWNNDGPHHPTGD